MTAGDAGKLYTPEILSLAVKLAEFPLKRDHKLVAESRSRSCGSSLKIGLTLGADDMVTAVGVMASACAVGQAAAAIFACNVTGRSAADIARSHRLIEQWLTGAGPQPDWPAIGSLDAARHYRARQGAILLSWRAAEAALFKTCTSS